MSPENLLLRLSAEDEETVRGIYRELAQQGFPEQRQLPHITITFALSMQAPVVDRAAELLPPLLPSRFRRAGVVVFGTKSKQSVGWLLETTDPRLDQAALELNELNPEGRGPRWVPHLTMGLRIPKSMVADYITALQDVTSTHFTHLNAVDAIYRQPGVGETSLTRMP